ncbi:MAG: hypothetical protein RIR70_821 [Pseudomonadota bacterium]
MTTHAEFHAASIADPVSFWARESKRIDWHQPFGQVLDDERAPFNRWFVGGKLNLCHNAVDRHLAKRANQPALIYISTETGEEKRYTYRELHAEVVRMAAVLQAMGVGKGDRVLIYMPMIPEAVFAMLATVRLGAIHSVVFGGFAAASLATRIDDADPKVMVTSDAGMRGGKVIPYKPLVDEALDLCQSSVPKVLIVNRNLADSMTIIAGRDMDYAMLREFHIDEDVPCEWVESSHPSYILYTSGTTGKPKGVQRDTGGYAVALATSMDYIYGGKPGETFFSTSDIGWVVGHSYIVYGPLLHGMATVVYEGLPIRPDPGVWWKIVQDHKVTVMFSAPTAVRVLKKQDPAFMKAYDLSSLRHLFLAGEPLDEPTHRWVEETLGKPVYDHYWQTETGWAILSPLPSVQKMPTRAGSPSFPAYGFNVKLLKEDGSEISGAQEKGVVAVMPPLPPGCLSTVWGQDERFVKTYFTTFPGKLAYSTFDWGIRDEEGYFFILGRTDDVINVAGHRLGTREIEEAICGHNAIAEVAVVGVNDALKGQVPLAFAVVKDPAKFATLEACQILEREVMQAVDAALGAIGRPAQVHVVSQLPKTRSGKVLRRAIAAVAQGQDPGDLTTLDDPVGIERIRAAVNPAAN